MGTQIRATKKGRGEGVMEVRAYVVEMLGLAAH